MSSSSSGTCGGLKKLKKLSQFSVLVIGLAFFEPFLGFFLRIFCVRHFPGCHWISVLKEIKEIKKSANNLYSRLSQPFWHDSSLARVVTGKVTLIIIIIIIPAKKKHNNNNKAYPIAFSNIGSSSSIIWYVFVKTELIK